MIEVLIAEDELPFLRGIKTMIERLNPEFQVVMCARNGREAIQYLEDHKVDVVFTDINMPLVDGLEVMKYVFEHYPGTDQVVISGYHEFAYAREALCYGARSYLLKPLDQGELTEILKELQIRFEKRRLKEQRERLTEAVYTGKQAEEQEMVQILYLCAGNCSDYGMEEFLAEYEYWNQLDAEQKAQELLPPGTGVYLFEKNQINERILLIDAKQEIDLGAFSKEYLGEITGEQMQITIAFHQEPVELRMIPIICHQLRREISEQILFGKSAVVNFEPEVEIRKLADSQKDALRFVGKCGKMERAEVLLGELEQFMERVPVTRRNCAALLHEILSLISEGSGKPLDRGAEEIIQNMILYSQDIPQLFTNLRMTIQDAIEADGEDSREGLMEKVDQYIKNHSEEPITTKRLAEEFGLVAPYLSKLFKDYKGYSPTQYIQEIRLERAKKLLLMDGEILAKDVAEMVGYQNPLYFSKVFKKNVGVYPSEYRAQNKK